MRSALHRISSNWVRLAALLDLEILEPSGPQPVTTQGEAEREGEKQNKFAESGFFLQAWDVDRGESWGIPCIWDSSLDLTCLTGKLLLGCCQARSLLQRPPGSELSLSDRESFFQVHFDGTGLA